MIMAHNRDLITDSHSFQGIMNAVSVKISERYRPPRKITVSSGVLQRKKHEDLSFMYNFSLEESIASKMHQMKQLRTESKQTLKKHLASYHQAIQNEQFTNSEDETRSVEEEDNVSTVVQDVTAPPHPMSPVPNHMQHQYEPTDSPILSPVPFEQSNSHQAPGYRNNLEMSEFSNSSQVPIRCPIQYSNPPRTPVCSPVQFMHGQDSPDPTKATCLPYAQSHLDHSPPIIHTHPNYVSNSTSYPVHPTNSANTVPYSTYSMAVPTSVPNTYMNTVPHSSVPSNPIPYSRHYSVPQSNNYVTTSSSLGSPVVHSCTAPDIHALTGGSGPPNHGYAPRFSASVLQPTHLLANLQNRTVTKDKQKQVNVQDFENDTSSPFDNVELKSINDIEELRHVLEQTVMIQQQLQQQHEANLQQMQHHQDQQYHGQQDQQQMQHQASQFKPYPPHYAPNYRYEPPPPSHQYKSTQTSLPHPHPSYIPPTQSQSFPSLNHNESSPPFHTLTHQGGSHPINPAFIPHSRHHFPPSQPYGPPQSNTMLPSQPHGPPQSNNIPVSEQQHDNAYSQISSEMRERSSRESCDVPRVPSILCQLRDELKRKQEERLSQPEISSPPPSASTPSACDTIIQPTPSPLQVSHLDNPYLSLPASSQTLVDQITEMGFLQSRSARACAQFGPHQEKIIEFLIQVLSLEERFPSLSGTDECELCLLQFKCDMSATGQFLSHVVNLMRLGFDAHRVVRALRSAGNSEERALDILVS
uniref:UBA domain-containing protein n=1 Tax=Cacopsylla melanoneura TaxID=428564 RepID=A0A8D9EG28_9HEMI